MAKRTRGTRAAQLRPGQRVANSRPSSPRPPTSDAATSAVATTPASPSSDLIIEQALEAEVVSGAPATATASDIRRSTPGRVKVKPNSLLAARAQTEYVYVGQDLRKIAVVAAALFGVLLLLWVLLVVVGLFGIY